MHGISVLVCGTTIGEVAAMEKPLIFFTAGVDDSACRESHECYPHGGIETGVAP